MKYLGRLAVGLLMVCSMPLSAGIVWIESEHGDAGPLPGTAQSVYGNNDIVDAIYGNLNRANGADMYRIFITDPRAFTADVFPNPDPSLSSNVTPQLFLLDSQGFPIVGAFGAFVGFASLPVGPDTDVPGYYYLLIDSVGHDPTFLWVNRKGNTVEKPLFCTPPPDPPPAFESEWVPCPGNDKTLLPDASTQTISGYKGQALDPTSTGAYIISFGDSNSVTAPNPEPGTVVMMMGGLAAVLAAAGGKRRSAALRAG